MSLFMAILLSASTAAIITLVLFCVFAVDAPKDTP